MRTAGERVRADTGALDGGGRREEVTEETGKKKTTTTKESIGKRRSKRMR